MKKIVILTMLSFLITCCGPSEKEKLLESDCSFYYESILEVKEYLKAFNDEEVLNDEEIASAYRDNLRQIIEYNAAFIGRCEEVESLDYHVLNEKIARDLYLENLYTNVGYWKAK